ncbi:MAG: hypothetical protein WC389_20945 [Lutibacter sp.]
MTGKQIPIPELVKNIVYTDKKHYPKHKEGKIVWNATDWSRWGIKFLGRFYGCPVREVNDGQFRVLNVDKETHWVRQDYFGNPITSASDPWGRRIKDKYGYTRLLKTSSINGFALFSKI